MKKRLWIPIVILAATLTASGQTARPIGVVTAVDAGAGSITLHTDSGQDVVVRFDERTAFLRIAPGERNLNNAVKIAIADVGVGDRILARGTASADSKSIAASSVIVMSKADIDKRHMADRAEWKSRGIGGIVTALKPEAKELTISVPSLMGSKTVIVTPAGNAVWRRYAPDSVKFSDAKPSRFEEIVVGDQVRALGNKSDDGTRFTAEELVSGSFLNIAATVDAVNPSDSMVKVSDLATKKHLTVRVAPESNLRMVPPFLARMLAMRNAGEAGTEGRLPPAGGRPGFSGRPPEGNRPGMSSPAGTPDRPRDLESLIEKMPAVTLADLKPGAAIAIASTRGADPSQVTAITILSGIEPLLTATPQGGRQMLNGSWNLNMNMNMDLP